MRVSRELLGRKIFHFMKNDEDDAITPSRCVPHHEYH
jgi:hypothetical protein